MGDQNIAMIKADVNKSADSIEAAADHVAGIDIQGAFGDIAKALPDSTAAAAARSAASALDKDRDGWVKQARAHHTQTRADAARIHKTDELIAANVPKISASDAGNLVTTGPSNADGGAYQQTLRSQFERRLGGGV